MSDHSHLDSTHVQIGQADPRGSPDLVLGDAASFEEQLANATLDIPSSATEAGPGEFADLVTPGTPLPYSGPPVAVRRGMDPVPDGIPWFYVEPTLDEIEAVQDVEDRAWLLHARIVNNPSPPTERELDMINPLLGGDGAVFMFLEIRLASPLARDERPPLRKRQPAPAAPRLPCLFKAFAIELGKGDTHA